MRMRYAVALGLAWVVLASSCGPTVRRSGQIEMFTIEGESDTGMVRPPRRTYSTPTVTREQARIGSDARVDPELGDLVRFTTDSVTITVPSVYLDHLPMTLSSATTGRYDAMLFAEVWENAAMDRTEPSLNRIVHVALDQPIPGRLNFQDAIAYGPTTFKGHPLRIKFTLVLLQRRAKESGDTAAKSLQDFIAMAGAGTPAAAGASTVVALIRQVMRSLPDVEAFDFEATLIPYNPPSTLEVSRSLSERRVSASIIAASKAPIDLAGAKALGANILALVEDQQRAADERLIGPIEKARAQESGRDLTSAIASIQLDQVPFAHAQSIQAKIDEIRTFELAKPGDDASDNASRLRLLDSLKEAATAANAARRAQEFQSVRRGAAALQSATTDADVTMALATIRSCADYERVAGRAVAVEPSPRDINARPWFRYLMYALIETAQYRSAGATPRFYDMAGATFERERLYLAQADRETAFGASPNWMLMDVLPGQQPNEESVLRAASDAASRMFDLTGYVPSRRLIDDPSQLKTHLDAIRNDTFETLLQVRAERLAMDHAREHRRALDRVGTPGGPSDPPASPFVDDADGAFKKKFKALVDGLAQSDASITESRARWDALGERVRVQFARRFE